MMFSVKVSIVALFAVVLFSAAAAGPAAANWFVGGTELATSAKAEVNGTAKVDAPVTFHITTAKITAKCSSGIFNGENVEIIGTNKGAAKALIFRGCEVTEPTSGCRLESTEIKTEPVNATVTKGSGKADIATFTPQTKNTFGEVRFASDNTCAFDEPEPIKGAFRLNMPTGQEELVEQAVEGLGSVENNSLELAGDKLLAENGKALLKLVSGSKWSFH